MSNNFYANMYGVKNVPVATVITQAEREKRAVKILGGMKIHNSHLKQVQIGSDLVNVPKIEYVQLLEGQIKEARNKIRDLENKVYRLLNNQDKLAAEIRDVKLKINSKSTLR